jgi:hypothetical protein
LHVQNVNEEIIRQPRTNGLRLISLSLINIADSVESTRHIGKRSDGKPGEMIANHLPIKEPDKLYQKEKR